MKFTEEQMKKIESVVFLAHPLHSCYFVNYGVTKRAKPKEFAKLKTGGSKT